MFVGSQSGLGIGLTIPLAAAQRRYFVDRTKCHDWIVCILLGSLRFRNYLNTSVNNVLRESHVRKRKDEFVNLVVAEN